MSRQPSQKRFYLDYSQHEHSFHPQSSPPPTPVSIPPLKSLALASAPLTTHTIAWSPDAELAIACDDAINVFFPTFPNPPASPTSKHADGAIATDAGGGGSLNTTPLTMLPASLSQTGQFFSHRTRWPCTRPPEQRINAALLAAAGVQLKVSRPIVDDDVDKDDEDDEDDEWRVDEGKESFEQQHQNEQQGEGSTSHPILPDRWWEPGASLVTRFGAAMSQVVSLSWSPSGMGHNLRPVLAVLMTSGVMLVYGEHANREDVEREMASRVRSFRGWGTLWGVGARLPLVDGSTEDGYRPCDDRATAFAWAKGQGVGPGMGLLGYMTAKGEVVVMSVTYQHRDDGCAWAVEEAGRFVITGPHGKENVWDPDHVPSASAFALAWSPWLHHGDGSRSTIVAYTVRHYVGFRRVTIASSSRLNVEDHDVQGICCHLGTDAFVVWEDTMTPIIESHGHTVEGTSQPGWACRALIATPFTVRAVQIPMTAAAGPVEEHGLDMCGSQYPATDVSLEDMQNPITGLYIHPSPPDVHTRTPPYSLTRMSATHANDNWYQQSNPHAQPAGHGSSNQDSVVPQWVDFIRRTTHVQVPVSVGLAGAAEAAVQDESDQSGSEDEDEEDDAEGETDDDDDDDEIIGEDMGEYEDRLEVDGVEPQVHPYRIRIWGMAASPGAGGSVVLLSQHSTQRPERACRMVVMFDWRERAPQTAVVASGLSTEGKVWEHMYSNGPAVEGVSLTDSAGGDEVGAVMPSVLAARMLEVRNQQRCVYCTAVLRHHGRHMRCQNNHMFDTCAASGLAILAPGISRVCGVCGRRTMMAADLQRLASERGAGDAVGEIEELVACGGCGGKFVV